MLIINDIVKLSLVRLRKLCRKCRHKRNLQAIEHQSLEAFFYAIRKESMDELVVLLGRQRGDTEVVRCKATEVRCIADKYVML